MTAVIAAACGLTAGAAASWRITYRWCVTRGDLANYDAKRDWRALHEQADHDHRTARRWKAIADARAHAIQDLATALRVVALRPPRRPPAHMRRIVRLRTRRRSAIPAYGGAR